MIAHDESAVDLNPQDDSLKVVKLHGDFLFSDIDNTEEQTKDLRQYMKEGLELFLRVGGLIVVGYSGRDDSVMSPLEDLMDDPNAFRYPLYWVVREGATPSERVRRLIEKAGNRGAFIEAPSSDEFFWCLHRSLCGEEAAGPRPGSDEPFAIPTAELRRALLQGAIDEHLNALITQIQAEAWFERYQPLAIRQLILQAKETGDASKLYDIFGAAEDNQYLVILGAPGAGKTTSLRRLALEKARENSRIPIFVELGGYRGDLIGLIETYFHGTRSRETVQFLLENGDCLVILDGLNETGEHYQPLVEEVLSLVHQYGSAGNRWIVSCRSYNYGGELDETFSPMEVQPLLTYEVFLSLQKVIGEARATKWWEDMDDRIRTLCTNPLMLRMLLDVAAARDQPPKTRCQLIGSFMDELLVKWERRFQKQQLGAFVKKQLLGIVAYEMGASVTTLDESLGLELIGTRLEELIEQALAPGGSDAESALDELLTNGLLRKTGHQIAFMHQAVQEYFLAIEMLERQADISPHVADEQWHETLFYMAEMAADATPIVRKVRDYDAILAARCLDFVENPRTDTVDSVIRRLIHRWVRDKGIWIGAAKEVAKHILALEVKTATPLPELLGDTHPKRFDQSQDYLYVGLLQEAGEWNRALRHSERLDQESEDERFLFHARRGISFDEIGRLDEAKVEYQKALRINPNADWVHGNLANTLDDLGEVRAAEGEYLKAIELDDDALNRANYGTFLREQGRYLEARKQLERSIALDPDYPQAYYNLGLIEQKQRNYGAAAEFFQKASDLNEFDADYALLAGDCWEAIGSINQAIQAWRRFLDIEPTHEAAQRIYANILHYEGRDYLFTAQRFGRVKWFNDNLGYGFITQQDGTEIFVHYSDIEAVGWKTLTEGENVKFEIQETPRGFKAARVRTL